MKLSRRKLLAGGAALGVAAPAAQHLMWSQKDFTLPGYDPTAPQATATGASWINWSGSQKATPTSIKYPTGEAELQELIRTSTGRARPVGSGHSFTGLARSSDMMIDLAAMDSLIGYDPATGHATFGAGTKLFHAAAELNQRGRAFANLPDIDVQTLAGSFATGTHGTGNQLTALHDYIEGFRLVTATGDVLDVSRNSDPDLFQAGKVSLGALGIMTQFTVRTVPAFSLHRKLTIEPMAPFFDRIEALGEQHRNFEFFYSPSTQLVAWLSHDEYVGAPTEREDSQDDAFLLGLKQLRDSFGWFPWLRRKIAQASFPTGLIEDVKDESWALLSTTRPHKFNEMEYHLPQEHGVATLRKIVTMLDRKKDVFFPLEYRHVAADDAWLSPFNGGPRSSIAIHAAADEPYDYFFSEFEPVYRAVGGRPHWGKHHSLRREALSALYPAFETFLALRRDLDPSGKFLNRHLSDLFGESFNG